MVHIDLLERTLNVALSPEEIAQRLEHAHSPKEGVKSRWLRRYASLVTSANTGAVMADI